MVSLYIISVEKLNSREKDKPESFSSDKKYIVKGGGI